VTTLPRYFSSVIPPQYELYFSGTQGGHGYFNFSAFTRRHMGAARTRDTSPAATTRGRCPLAGGVLLSLVAFGDRGPQSRIGYGRFSIASSSASTDPIASCPFWA
jgi:hypothetical protein